MADVAEKSTALKITFEGGGVLAEATKNLIEEAIKDGSASAKLAAMIPGAKLTLLGNLENGINIGVSYQQGDAYGVGEGAMKVIGGIFGGMAGTPVGRVIGAMVPVPGGSFIGAVAGGIAGGKVGEKVFGEYIWPEIANKTGQGVTIDLGFTQMTFSNPTIAGVQVVSTATYVPQLADSSTPDAPVITMFQRLPDGSLVQPSGIPVTRDPDVATSSTTYVIKNGDTLWELARADGVTLQDYIDANPQITHPDLINIGQVINKPASALTPNTNLFTPVTNTTPTPTGSTTPDATSSVSSDNSSLFSNGDYSFGGLGNVNTATGIPALINDIISDGYRPGNQNLADPILASNLAQTFLANPDAANYLVWDPTVKAAALNLLGTGVQNAIPTDPLVLDLNGDGVKLTAFGDAPVLFDIDHDGGTKEVTGWVSKEDGIVVMDLNGNGKIDDISETMSEYFYGTVGTGGNAGTKPYANGFAALKSLDSNGDNAFTSADAAFGNVRVWQDTNHDGVTDTGELKTFTELDITSVNLVTTLQSGLVNGGNEVLATGSFTQSGQTKEAQAARFIANATGNTTTVGGTGTTVAAEDGQSSYVSAVTTGEAIDVAAKGVKNAYGNSGNDTLTGDANANWLVGGQGSDAFSAGAGDDMLIIDAQDLQQNIHAGDGNDMVQVVGADGVTLNLAQAEVEVAVGGTGNDVFIGGGRSSVFVRAGDGDDLIIGGAANDALSGENGNDFVDGGSGNDVIRGGRGLDQLLGGAGDDVIDGGLEDDRLSGGEGNDVLIGGSGDDVLDGGAGADVAEFTGSYADYRVTKLDDATWRVVDTKTGRDGADTLTNIEQLSFADIGHFDITQPTALPVKDVLTTNALGQTLTRTGSYYISKEQLLANDLSWQGTALSITAVLDAKGGTAQLITDTADAQFGNILFTPDAAYKGVMSFKYQVKDSNDNISTAVIPTTGVSEQLKGAVYLQTPDLPTDPLALEQWYLSETNVIPVWQDYTGKGVRIGQFEPGGPYSVGPEVFDYQHPDLQANVDLAWLNDPSNAVPQTFSNHATMVAGVMVAARNGEGGVGVAYDAKLSGHYIQGTGLEVTALEQEITDALAQFKNYDVVNNSWGATSDFLLNVVPTGTLQSGILDAVQNGRGGLGTAIVMAAGNDRATGSNTNTNALTANQAVITVGAINAPGDLGSLQIGQTPFSNPGASILVSAPGSNVDSTGSKLISDSGSVFGSDTQDSQGTSFAAPIVSGVVALMLEANPNLGYRDIQSILALTARKIVDPNGTDWTYNAAKNWNGGGMHASHDYGFGEVDARAAVRLAETWYDNSTDYNLDIKSASSGALNAAIPDGTSTYSNTLNVAAGVEVESAQVTLQLDHQHWGDLIIKLISPSGTESILLNRTGKAPGSGASDLGSAESGLMDFSFNTTHVRGEQSGGVWTLQVIDAATGAVGTVKNWKLDLYGSTTDSNDTYVYTDEFGSFAGTQRATLTDTNGGKDILNASAVSTNSTINLNNGSANTIAGKALTISGDIEYGYGGDGNDSITGNTLSNVLVGGRGDDTLSSGGGNDLLDGGQGTNTLTGGALDDIFVIQRKPGAVDVITDFSVSEIGEKIAIVGFDNILDFTQLSLVAEGADSRINLPNGQSLLMKSLVPSQLSEQNFSFFTTYDLFKEYVSYRGNAMVTNTTNGSDQFALPNTSGDLQAFALGGNDLIAVRTANDLLDGGNGDDDLYGDYMDPANGYPAFTPGNDWMEGGAGSDYLYGNGGSDKLFGGSGNDAIWGGDGNDLLVGSTGQDYLDGEGGNDVLVLEGDLGKTINGAGDFGARVGGAGADMFSVTATGGGTSGISLSFTANGTEVSASNLITDFEVATPGEVIDLSALTWITGFSDLTFSASNVSGTIYTRVSANKDGKSLNVTLENVTASQLNASHFKFAAPTPGLIQGTTGNDTLTGDAGANTIDGLAGVDTMTGRTGDDTYKVDNAGDTVNELPGGGFDTVLSSVSYALSADVEALTLTSTANLNATGNDGRNRLHGNTGDNRLDGGAEADDMRGGAGNDTYVVDSQLDTVTENANEGSDTVESAVSWTLGDNVENLTLTGTTAINGTGNVLANTLRGNSGDNVLDGATGADTMIGGLGNDTYYVENVGDVVTENANEGIDTVYSNYSRTLDANVENGVLYGDAAILTGNALDNTLIGNAANNTLIGGDGADQLDGGAGNDTLQGGLGDDIYFVDTSADVVTENTGQGYDTVVSSVTRTLESNVENLVLTGTAAINGTGNTLNNKLTGNSANNVLTGAAGNDTLDGGAGVDTLAGGVGEDTYVVDNAEDVVTENLNEGWGDLVESSITYTLGANVENLTLTGTAAINATGNALDNTLTGNSANNVLTGGAGNDYLDGGVGADTMAGGLGDDYYYLDNINDVVIENVGEGDWDAVETRFSYTLTTGANIEGLILGYGAGDINGTGNAANDYLQGNEGANVLTGLAGNDELAGEGGLDTLIGGTGDDTYYLNAFDGLIADVVENANEGTDSVYFYGLGAGATYTLATNVENATSWGSGLNLTGNALNNQLTGDYGNNVLNGGAGTDTLAGLDGNDTYYVDNAGDVVTENANQGTDTVYSSIDYTDYSSIDYTLGANLENLILTSWYTDGGDWYWGSGSYANGTGNNLNNRIDGNLADNFLQGLGGNDTLIGGYGYDNLLGGDGNDLLDGGDDEDSLNGGAGADTMVGGNGNDTYYIDNAGDTVIETEAAGSGIDTVQFSLASDYTLVNVENLLRDSWSGDVAVSHGNFRTVGNASGNLLSGNLGSDTLIGLGGNDTFYGGWADGAVDVMEGGSGDDTYNVDAEDIVTELADEGIDLVYVNGLGAYTLQDNVENGQRYTGGSLTGNGLDNRLTGSYENDTLVGLAGNDTIDGGSGVDALIGGGGDDTYLVDSTTDVISEMAGQGTDTIISRVSLSLASIADVENLTLYGRGYSYSDSPINGTGNGLDNVITGNGAANRLDGGAGIDTLVGGLGGDTYVVDNLGDQIVEYGYGTDTVESSISYSLASLNDVENLTLTGTALSGTGNDRNNLIVGNAAANTLDGGAGNDTLDGGAGIDTLIGGTGNDVYIVDSSSDTITEYSSGGTDTVQSSVTYSLVDTDGAGSNGGSVENLTLTGASAITGMGNALSNVIVGNVAANTLYGNDGDDILDGGAGNDVLNGGNGSDTASYTNTTAAVTVNLQTGQATGGAGSDTLTLIENVTGGRGNDSIVGDASANVLDGWGGDDTLQGGAGDDFYLVDSISDVVIESFDQGIDTVKTSASGYSLAANVENLILDGVEYPEEGSGSWMNGFGNGLNNVITGNYVDNYIDAGDGNDTLDGQAGSDYLIGREGSDVYLFGRGYDADTIYDGQSVGSDTDILRFLSDVSIDQLWFSRSLDNLEVSIIGTSDKATIVNWYGGDQYHVEQLKTTDGAKTLLDSNVENLVNAMASFAPPAAGQTTLPQNYQDALAGVIAANWQ
ncbi:S8 family serine peptidase [Thiobacillus sp.]|uniref:S8 family serine peptidase n=1 Tax=Thiobacillus sp. TaxID=924 RepID=UPI00179B7339|nr:S8 family serine peptidase [Thiobacillus sp.]MBC2732440.1 S8 family serine peptidase [Thiobacillus sp.]MBC2741178.1 S8 family serine peptidase [Thiobacillus sp.]MBC2759869.1 S8 family serine peptidase [Thiobacillus sp.]